MRLAVSPAVLIPRPETEVLVEAALMGIRCVDAPRIADVGTGSGALALALAREIPDARIIAIDASQDALAVARENARALGFADRIEFRHGHLAAPLLRDEPVHAIVANLPYVTRAEWEDLQPEVRDHEPRLALVGGDDGLDLVRELIAQAPDVLVPGGWMGLELGWKQAPTIRDLLASSGWTDVATGLDLAAIERVISARAPGAAKAWVPTVG